MIPIASFYLGANPTTPTSYGSQRQQSTSQANIHHSPSASQPHANISTDPTTTSQNAANRASMPPPSRSSPPQSPFVGQASQKQEVLDPTPEEEAEQRSKHEAKRTASKERRRSRQPGTMNKAFKFPPTSPTTPPGLSNRKHVEMGMIWRVWVWWHRAALKYLHLHLLRKSCRLRGSWLRMEKEMTSGKRKRFR